MTDIAGAGNSVALHRFGGDKETHFPNGKAFNQVLKPGDAYILRSGGGGGFGSPLERDLDALARDVSRGYVSRGEAETVYGAVFALDGSIDGSIDRQASATRRAAMREQGLPVDRPIAESPVLPPPPLDHRHAHPPETLTEEERVALAMSGRCCS